MKEIYSSHHMWSFIIRNRRLDWIKRNRRIAMVTSNADVVVFDTSIDCVIVIEEVHISTIKKLDSSFDISIAIRGSLTAKSNTSGHTIGSG